MKGQCRQSVNLEAVILQKHGQGEQEMEREGKGWCMVPSGVLSERKQRSTLTIDFFSLKTSLCPLELAQFSACGRLSENTY